MGPYFLHLLINLRRIWQYKVLKIYYLLIFLYCQFSNHKCILSVQPLLMQCLYTERIYSCTF
jgi:hypothetical protein